MEFYINNKSCILVFGGAGIDYVARVPRFPERDAKIRTTEGALMVGGNAANTSAALGRLGANCRLISKVGSDHNAQHVISSLSSDMGVVVEDIITSDVENELTAFTYVIACEESLSRTCIHTPLLSEITASQISHYIQSFSLSAVLSSDVKHVHFDSRHTEAASILAEYIHHNKTNTVLTIDIEKSRPHLAKLIQYCHVIFTNKRGIKEMFPSFRGTDDEDFVKQAASFLSDNTNESDSLNCCKLVILTDGSNGSAAIFSSNNFCESGASNNEPFDVLLPHNILGIEDNFHESRFSSIMKDSLSTIAVNGAISIRNSTLETTDGSNRIGIVRCSSFSVDATDIVDTTGAGDAFVGGFLFGMMQRLTVSECMLLGTIVATETLYCLGAQTNLPSLNRVVDIIKSRADENYIITFVK